MKRFLTGPAGNEVCVTDAAETCSCLSRPYKTAAEFNFPLRHFLHGHTLTSIHIVLYIVPLFAVGSRNCSGKVNPILIFFVSAYLKLGHTNYLIK
jgi:hypothetical protein